jgi:hypothetical protein
MKILHEYDFAGQHYGLVELDNGDKVEIQDDDPLKKAAEMQAAGMFARIEFQPPLPEAGNLLEKCSDEDLLAEVKKRMDDGRLALTIQWVGKE